jgi:C4-dicarboxylate-specific signal transduction histidine kinase
VVALIIGWLSGLQHEATQALKRTSNELREKADELERSNATLHAEIAAREQAQAELLRSRTELAHMNRVMTLGELAASIAHEINQPLAAIMMKAAAARRWLNSTPPHPDKTLQSLAGITNDAQRAADVIERIHNLVRKNAPQMQRLEINDAIIEVVTVTHGEAAKNDVTVRMRLADHLPHTQGDRVQLQQVMLNLIINAIQAMSGLAGGKRELHISTGIIESEGVCVAVRDTGPGISAENLQRLFEPFYTTKPNGMGMGLSICRSIIEDHGGRLWATQHDEPRGALFQFTIPVTQPVKS